MNARNIVPGPFRGSVHPGIVGDWSAKDILGHVTTWEGACLEGLTGPDDRPEIVGLQGGLQGGYHGVNRFNAETVAGKRGLALVQVLKEFAQSHLRVVEFIRDVAEVHFARETPFRQRLRWDTYSHYREHARA